MMIEAQPYEPASQFVLRRVGKESILVPIQNRVGDLDSVFTLNEVASFVWSMIDGKTTREAMIARLCDAYDVDATSASADLDELLTTLHDAKLIRTVA